MAVGKVGWSRSPTRSIRRSSTSSLHRASMTSSRLLDRGVTNIAVDMPIGLPESGPPRATLPHDNCSDRGARRCSPRHRDRSCTSATTPPRSPASAPSTGRASRSRASTSFPKIAEIDAAISPAIQPRVVECHPELAFQRRHGGRWRRSTTREGLEQRRALVGDLLGDQPIPRLRGTAPHDVLDAMALTFTARALLHDDAERLGDGTRRRPRARDGDRLVR